MHFPIYSKFFYYKLNEQEKKVYTNILNSWLSYKKRVMLVNVSVDLDFNKIFKSICDDTPELFYIDFSRISVSAGQNSYSGISSTVIHLMSLCSSFFGMPSAIVALNNVR